MRVLIPRGGPWGDDVAARVRAAGHEPVLLPLVRISPAEDDAQLQRMFDQLAEGHFDWLVVSSQSTARMLPPVPERVLVAAVGNVTAAALRERGISVGFVPSQQSAAGLVDEWPIREGRVLWPHALDAKPTVADGLRQHGMQVSEAIAYRTTPEFESTEQLAAALDGVAPVDAVLVTSGSVAKQVARLSLVPSTVVIAIGAQTADDCRRAGLEVSRVAAQPNPTELIAALVAAAPPTPAG